jgi:glycosyltransferase involved in cell wall biosynthesis
MNLLLPDLEVYKKELEQKCIVPLQNVPFVAKGLLSQLPKSDNTKIGWPWTVETSSILYNPQEKYPKITIVTPSFNQGKFIEETIRSVLLQNYPNLEFIIIDGGSTDNTVEVLHKYAPWISFWQSEKDRGQSHAINLGFSMASGEYYGWINSDDFYLPGAFSEVSKSVRKEKFGLIYGDSVSLAENDTKIYYEYGKLVLDKYLRFGGIISSHAAFWKASIHQPVLEEMKCAMDYELWLRLVKGKARKHIPLPLGVFRLHDSSKSVNDSFSISWKQDHLYLEEIYGNEIKANKYLMREFSIVQKLYRRFCKFYYNKAQRRVINEWWNSNQRNISEAIY